MRVASRADGPGACKPVLIPPDKMAVGNITPLPTRAPILRGHMRPGHGL